MIITAAFTAYGKKAKCRLIELDMTQTQLIEKLKEKTGLYMDDSYLYKVFTGQNQNRKVIGAINEILGITDGEN